MRLTRRELFEIAGGLAFAAPAAAWTDAPSLEDTARRAADVIRGYSASIDPGAAGLALTAFVSIKPFDPAAPDDAPDRVREGATAG